MTIKLYTLIKLNCLKWNWLFVYNGFWRQITYQGWYVIKPDQTSKHLPKPLLSVPSAPATIGITVTFNFHRFLNSLESFKYLTLFDFHSKRQFFGTRSGILAGIKGYAFISKPQRILCFSFSWTDSDLRLYQD